MSSEQPSSNNNPPRKQHDKFAALAASSSAATAPAAAPPTTQGAAPAPKRDKFAALAAHPPAATQPPVATTTTQSAALNAPKRDKFSALAGRAAATTDATTSASTTAAAAAPKRDKFAAMASRPETTRSSSMDEKAGEGESSKQQKEQTQFQEWETRKNQRAVVWKDLEDAEKFVLQLLDQAHETAVVLAKRTSDSQSIILKRQDDEMEEDDEDGTLAATSQRLASMYRDTLNTIHGKLAPHADLVQAYKEPQRINRIYQARIEEGLARQRRELLAGMLQLEKLTAAKRTAAVKEEGSETVPPASESGRKRGADEISTDEAK